MSDFVEIANVDFDFRPISTQIRFLVEIGLKSARNRSEIVENVAEIVVKSLFGVGFR